VIPGAYLRKREGDRSADPTLTFFDVVFPDPLPQPRFAATTAVFLGRPMRVTRADRLIRRFQQELGHADRLAVDGHAYRRRTRRRKP
jgi:hypothetical protein